jgi:hypothetical protein
MPMLNLAIIAWMGLVIFNADPDPLLEALLQLGNLIELNYLNVFLSVTRTVAKTVSKILTDWE